MPPKKKRKVLTSGEVLKDIQKDIKKILDGEDNEHISDEDVNLDELYGEKVFLHHFISTYCQTVS